MLRSFINTVKYLRTSLFSSQVAPVACENKMKAFVRKPIWENQVERLNLVLQYLLPDGTSRTFNFNRSVNEELGVAVDRITENIHKQANKQLLRKKKKKNPGELPKETVINVKIVKNGFELPRSLPVDEALTDDTSLVINDIAYQICVNVPKITFLALPNSIMVGFEYFPTVMMEYGDTRNSVFEWFKSEQNEMSEAAEVEPSFNWIKIHTGFSFMPENGDIGKKLKLICTPKNTTKDGEPMEVISVCEVTPSPGFCPFMTRHAVTKERAKGFRAVSYNLLADYYADSDFSREHLFPYCPPYALHIDYRKPVFTSEVVGYNADIVCLQECDVKVFMDQLLPILDIHGLQGVMKQKGTTAEGTAVFFARNKFKLIGTEDTQISDYLMESPSMKEIHEKISQSEALKERIEKRQTSLQVVVLESLEDPTRRVLVANTHLYWHPKGGHIRMLQTATCIKFIEELLPKYTLGDKTPTVVFAGDFNSWPPSIAQNFITKGFSTTDHDDWMKGGEEEYVGGLELKHSLRLSSACGYPEFTNYTEGF